MARNPLDKLYRYDTLTDMAKSISIETAAARLRVTPARVRVLCRDRRIAGARLLGRTWMLPADFSVTPGTRGPKLKGRK
jgi:hypothetical protein